MTPAAPTLTQRHLSRALLARQFLLDRSSLPVPRVLECIAAAERLAAVHA